MGEVDYIIKTPETRKSRQLCHINMLKEYVERNNDERVKPVCSVGPSQEVSHDGNPEMEVYQHDNGDDNQHEYPMKLQNSDMLANVDGKLDHLSDNVQCELTSRTNAADHDVDVGDHEAIKQHPYRVNPLKKAHLNKGIEYV